jgi:hypothetical protein
MTFAKAYGTEMTKNAVEHIKHTKEVWDKSQQKYSTDKAKLNEFNQAAAEVRRSLKPMEITHDRAATMKSLKFKVIQDLKMSEKLTEIR